MTIEGLFEYVSDIKPHAFGEKSLTVWLNDVETRLQREVLLLAPVELITYRWPEDRKTVPLLDPPHDAIYRHYLEAMIDYANGEYDKYQNTMEMFNACWDAFVCAFASAYRPADGYDGELWEGGAVLP